MNSGGNAVFNDGRRREQNDRRTSPENIPQRRGGNKVREATHNDKEVNLKSAYVTPMRSKKHTTSSGSGGSYSQQHRAKKVKSELRRR